MLPLYTQCLQTVRRGVGAPADWSIRTVLPTAARQTLNSRTAGRARALAPTIAALIFVPINIDAAPSIIHNSAVN